MKGYFLLFIIAISLLVGCDKREDYFKNISLPPSIGIARNGNVYLSLKDSVKVIKEEQRYYPIELKMGSQNSEINSLQFRITKGKGHIEFRNSIISSNSLPAEYQSLIMRYVPESLGEHEITFIATNRFGAKSELTTSILFFSNLPPKAVLEIKEVDKQTREFVLDASKSFSGDSKFGGYLTKYSFNINGEEYVLNSPMMHYIFPDAGEYQIRLKVIDGDGFAHETRQTFNIEK